MKFKQRTILKFGFAFILLFAAGNTIAQVHKKDTVRVGMYVENIYDLNFSNESFNTDYWLWFDYKNDSLELPQSMEVIRNKNVSIEIDEKWKVNNINWCERLIKATIIKKWNIQNFPFDKQKLTVETEIWPEDTSLVYVDLQKSRCKVDPSVVLNEWKITNVNFRKAVNNYSTSFGDPDLKDQRYYKIVFECDIKRNVTNLFIKLFIGVFISFAIALSSLFISSNHTDPRFGLPVGALFACIANKYVVDSIIPQTTNITLVDKIHFLTFMSILLVILISIISQRKFYSGKMSLSRRIDTISFWSIVGLYVSIILIWIF